MLVHLRIQNLAIVDHVSVEFEPGLNVITGETGAGKSMMADALGLLLGDRADKTIIRAGEAKCQVEATFQLADCRAIDQVLEDAELPACEEGILVIRRMIAAAGASRVMVNDAPVTLNVLRQLGSLLIDMHGPHEHQSLLLPGFQRDVLDAYGHLEDECAAYREAYRELLRLRSDRAALDGPEADTAARIDLLAFQVQELDAADLDHTDEQALIQEHTSNANASRILELGDGICSALTENDASVIDVLAVARRAIPELVDLMPDGEEWQSEVESIAVQIKELSSAISRAVQRIESDPERLQVLEDRMAMLQKLKRKYGADIPAMITFRERAREQLQALSGRGERIAGLDQAIREAEKTLHAVGAKLSKVRKKAAAALAQAITDELHDLGFAQATFAIHIAPLPDAGPYGIDEIDFGFAPNVGEPMRSLKAIASSGEISRVMLAVKAVLASHDRIPVLVFDEIDANLGGEMGNAVGLKLAQVAESHQVLCITHLPQVAVHGTTHFVASKTVREGRTCTAIAPIQGDARAEEVARMLGGKTLTSVTLQHAREMLKLK